MGTGPYRAPDGHGLTARVHGHYFGLVVGVVDAEALPLVLQQDDLGNTQTVVRAEAGDRWPRPRLGVGGWDTPRGPRCYSLIRINGAVPTTHRDICVSRPLLLNSTSSNYTPSGVMPELC